MLPVTSWPPVRPGYWSSPFGAPANVFAGSRHGGLPLPKGCWLVQAGPNKVVMLIRAPDPNEPYWRNPGTGIAHGFPPPSFPTWPNEDWPREGWPWAPDTGTGAQSAPTTQQRGQPSPWPWGGRGVPAGRFHQHAQQPQSSPPTPQPQAQPQQQWAPGYYPANIQFVTLLNPQSNGIVFSDGQNVRIFGTGNSTIIKVFSV